MSDEPVNDADGADQIDLPSVLDIAGSTAVREKILAQLKPEATVMVDASGLERMTTAGVQIVISAAAEAKQQNAHVKWASPPAPFVEAFSELGLYSRLMQLEFA